MANGISTEILVTRKVVKGWYVYTCATLPGLLVTGKDDSIAYNDVPESIRMLVKLDTGKDVVVTHKVSYAEFFQRLVMKARASEAVAKRTADLMTGTQMIAYNVASAKAAVRADH